MDSLVDWCTRRRSDKLKDNARTAKFAGIKFIRVIRDLNS
jgi:hypothetical protein